MSSDYIICFSIHPAGGATHCTMVTLYPSSTFRHDLTYNKPENRIHLLPTPLLSWLWTLIALKFQPVQRKKSTQTDIKYNSLLKQPTNSSSHGELAELQTHQSKYPNFQLKNSSRTFQKQEEAPQTQI
ncbi:hypothetical protein M758_7G073200 [Ceratodon purpureus]|nr:hypothetical protein M758_7G073200 [Ceratodon purpureus]